MAGKIKDITGKQFGEWTVLRFYEIRSSGTYWWCRCSCGLEKPVCGGDMKRGMSKSCGHDKKVDVSGQTIGEWKVLRKTRVDENYVTFYLCECSCGKIKEVRYTSLFTENPNCGHNSRKHPDIEVGMIFGEWTVIEKDDSNRNNTADWWCRCSCGTEKFVAGSSLLQGTSRECGHSNNDGISIGDRFGRLEVIAFAGRTEHGNSIWTCRCECGCIKDVHGCWMKDGTSTSCGCYAAELASIRATELLVKNNGHFVKLYDWYIKTDTEIIKCKSSFEVIVWNYFYWVLGKKIEYEPKTFIISSSSRYTPDFHLIESDTWLETKGSWNPRADQKNKIKWLKRNKGLDIKILFWKDIRKLCALKYKTLKTYFDHAKNLGIPVEQYLGEGMYLQ